MNAPYLFPQNGIVIDIRGGFRTKAEVISELLRHLLSRTALASECVAETDILKHLLAREKSFPTISEEFMFPHIRMHELKNSYMLFGVSREGIFFGKEKNPVHFLFLSLASDDGVKSVIEARAAILRMLYRTECERKVLEAKSVEEVWNILTRGVIANYLYL